MLLFLVMINGGCGGWGVKVWVGGWCDYEVFGSGDWIIELFGKECFFFYCVF